MTDQLIHRRRADDEERAVRSFLAAATIAVRVLPRPMSSARIARRRGQQEGDAGRLVTEQLRVAGADAPRRFGQRLG